MPTLSSTWSVARLGLMIGSAFGFIVALGFMALTEVRGPAVGDVGSTLVWFSLFGAFYGAIFCLIAFLLLRCMVPIERRSNDELRLFLFVLAGASSGEAISWISCALRDADTVPFTFGSIPFVSYHVVYIGPRLFAVAGMVLGLIAGLAFDRYRRRRGATLEEATHTRFTNAFAREAAVLCALAPVVFAYLVLADATSTTLLAYNVPAGMLALAGFVFVAAIAGNLVPIAQLTAPASE